MSCGESVERQKEVPACLKWQWVSRRQNCYINVEAEILKIDCAPKIPPNRSTKS